MPNRISRIFNRAALVLYAIGLLMLVIGVYLAPEEAEPSKLSRIAQLLLTLGYSILITTLVASILNDSFQSTIENKFAIVKGAEGAHLRRLYSLRQAGLAQVATESERANCRIDILCVAGTDILQPNTSVLAEMGRLFRDRSGVKVRVLVLDPRSRYAVERSVREEQDQGSFPPINPSQFDYPNKKLCEDILLALRQLQTIIDESAKSSPTPFSLSVRLYNSAPMMFLVALDDVVFIEQYHLGIPNSQEGGPFTRCLGKVVPLLEVPASSELGYVSANHFTYLWERSKKREMTPGSYDKIVESLKADDWLDKAMKVDEKDESDLAI
jgi:hypothetical protein